MPQTRDFQDTSPFQGVIQYTVGRDEYRAQREGIAVGVYHRTSGNGAFVRIATVVSRLTPRALHSALMAAEANGEY